MKCIGRELEVQRMKKSGLRPIFVFFFATAIFRFMSRHCPMCPNMGFWPQGLLCGDMGFPWSRQSSTKRDGFCRDRGFNVTTKRAKAG